MTPGLVAPRFRLSLRLIRPELKKMLSFLYSNLYNLRTTDSVKPRIWWTSSGLNLDSLTEICAFNQLHQSANNPNKKLL